MASFKRILQDHTRECNNRDSYYKKH